MQVWHLLESSKGYAVELAEAPMWAISVSRTVEFADAVTGHFMCGHFYRLFGWFLLLPDRREHTLHRIVVSEEVAVVLHGAYVDVADE